MANREGHDKQKATVLVADDDPQLLRLVARNLELAGYYVITAMDGQEALDLLAATSPDLAILDIMMPRLDGFTVCRRAREFSFVPILLLTARGQDHDKIRGFEAGADDYLTKPFSVGELLARVRAILRRTQEPLPHEQGNHAQLTVRDLTIDSAQRLVKRGERELVLTPIEYRLLALLAQNAGRVITHDLLLERIWGEDYIGETHLLQVSINRLRHKLEDDPAHPRYLLTKTGIGYLLATE